MAFTKPQHARALSALIANLKAAGLKSIPFSKPELAATMNGLKATLDTASYRGAQSGKIDAALAAHAKLSVAHKTILHRAALQAMLDEGRI